MNRPRSTGFGICLCSGNDVFTHPPEQKEFLFIYAHGKVKICHGNIEKKERKRNAFHQSRLIKQYNGKT